MKINLESNDLDYPWANFGEKLELDIWPLEGGIVGQIVVQYSTQPPHEYQYFR